MYVLITAFAIINIFFSFIDWIIVGNTDMNVAELTQTISANSTTPLNVNSTAGFRAADYVWVGDEKIAYNGKTNTTFLNPTRGYGDTDAKAHDKGTNVYARVSDAVNTSVGFNIVNTGASVGSINTTTLVVRFLVSAVPQMIAWNFTFLQEGWLQYLKLLLSVISIGFLIVLALQLLSGLGGLLSSAWNAIRGSP